MVGRTIGRGVFLLLEPPAPRGSTDLLSLRHESRRPWPPGPPPRGNQDARVRPRLSHKAVRENLGYARCDGCARRWERPGRVERAISETTFGIFDPTRRTDWVRPSDLSATSSPRCERRSVGSPRACSGRVGGLSGAPVASLEGSTAGSKQLTPLWSRSRPRHMAAAMGWCCQVASRLAHHARGCPGRRRSLGRRSRGDGYMVTAMAASRVGAVVTV